MMGLKCTGWIGLTLDVLLQNWQGVICSKDLEYKFMIRRDVL